MMNQVSLVPTFDTLQQLKSEVAEVGPTAGTSMSCVTAGSIEMVEVGLNDFGDDAALNLLEVEDDEEDDAYYDEMNSSEQDDYPPNYGAPKCEVEKLREELSRVKGILEEERKRFEDENTTLEEEKKRLEMALAESQEDRMHARIILQYEKDEKEKFQKLFYDEQRKKNQVKGQLNAIFEAKKALSGKDEEVTCLGTTKKTSGIGNRQNEPPEVISPVIDRTKIYGTNRNNIGGGLGGGALTRPNALSSQQEVPKVSPPAAPKVRPPSVARESVQQAALKLKAPQPPAKKPSQQGTRLQAELMPTTR